LLPYAAVLLLARNGISPAVRLPSKRSRLALLSADVDDALLGNYLNGVRWLSRHLKHRRLLTLTQSVQENYAPFCKFQRIVVLEWFILVDLSKDCRRVIYFLHLPPWD